MKKYINRITIMIMISAFILLYPCSIYVRANESDEPECIENETEASAEEASEACMEPEIALFSAGARSSDSFEYKGVTYYLSNATSKSDDNIRYWFENPGIFYVSEDTTSYYPAPEGVYGNVKIVYFEDGVTNVPEYFAAYFTRSQDQITEVRLPESCETLGQCAFYNCNSLETIDISCVKSFAWGCLQYCISLDSFEFGDGVTNISSEAFSTGDLSYGVFIPTELKGNTWQDAVIKYNWVDSHRLKAPTYKIISADNDELLVHEDFDTGQTIYPYIKNWNLKGYSGELYLDKECTVPVVFPFYSYTDVVFYVDIISGSLLSDVRITDYPTSLGEIKYNVFDRSSIQSRVNYRSGNNINIAYESFISLILVDLNGLIVEISTSYMDKETLEYSKATDISENGATVNGYSIKTKRLYTDDFEFQYKNGYMQSGFIMPDDEDELAIAKSQIVPGAIINAYCDILVSNNNFSKTLTIPVSFSVTEYTYTPADSDNISILMSIDRSLYPDMGKVSDISFYVTCRESMTYETRTVGKILDNVRLFRAEGSYPYTFVQLSSDDSISFMEYYYINDKNNEDGMDIMIDGSADGYGRSFGYSPGLVASGDYIYDIYYDLRAYGKSITHIQQYNAAEDGNIILASLETLNIDLKQYGSAKYRLYGVLNPMTIDDDFDFDSAASIGGLYSYGSEKSPGYSVNVGKYKNLVASDLKNDKRYIFYVIPLLNATISSSYSIKLPATLPISMTETGAEGVLEVKTKGAIAAFHALHVFISDTSENLLTGNSTNTELPFSVSDVNGDEYYYWDTISEDYPENGSKYTVFVDESDIFHASADTYTGTISVDFRLEPVF